MSTAALDLCIGDEPGFSQQKLPYLLKKISKNILIRYMCQETKHVKHYI